MPGPLWGGTNNQRSYSGPTTGSAFDSRTIPDSQGGGNLGVMSFQFSQSQQQAGWDAMNNAPGRFVDPIATLPGPLLNSSNAWMTELTPEAEQDVDSLLYGPLSELATTDPSDSTFDKGNIFLGPYANGGNLDPNRNEFFGEGYDMDYFNAVYGPGGILGPPAPPTPSLPGFTFLTHFEAGDWTAAEFSYIGFYDNTTLDVYEVHLGGDTYEQVIYGNSGGQSYYSDTIYVLGVGVLYHSEGP